jgi:hypothetical protein
LCCGSQINTEDSTHHSVFSIHSSITITGPIDVTGRK